jgi:hypothetical protein
MKQEQHKVHGWEYWRAVTVLNLRDYVNTFSNQLLLETRQSYEAGAVLVCTLVVTMARALSTAGGKLLSKASKCGIKHWHNTRWILYTKRTNSWNGMVWKRRQYYIITPLCMLGLLLAVKSYLRMNFQLTSRGRSWHYIGLPSISGIKKLCRDCYYISMLFVTLAQYLHCFNYN